MQVLIDYVRLIVSVKSLILAIEMFSFDLLCKHRDETKQSFKKTVLQRTNLFASEIIVKLSQVVY